MKNIYRAAKDDDVRVGYSFAGRRSDAEAYLDNPGFGGPVLYRSRVDMAGMIDLTESPWETLSETLGEEIDPAHHQYHFPSTVTACNKICDALAAKGYHWARIIDDYPEGCITYVALTAEAADAAEEAMEEVQDEA
jgi:hypothetical protein